MKLSELINELNGCSVLYTEKDVVAVWVEDFTSSVWTDGAKAYFLVGSKKKGTVLGGIPFSMRIDATHFQKIHGGVLKHFSTMTPSVLVTSDEELKAP